MGIKYSFEQWCIDENRIDILDRWDYDKNNINPSEIGYKSTKSVWMKCPNNIHDSSTVTTITIVRNPENNYCKKCNSFGQYVLNNYGEEFLNKIWSDKNDKDPFEISRRNQSRIYIKCLNDPTHPDFDIITSNFYVSYNCPYCVGKRVCKTNSLGYKIPKSVGLWSDKNEKTPFDYTPGCHELVWWKCENNKHDDYERMISRSVTYDLRCPECGRENQRIPRGKDHPSWKGGITPEIKAQRKSPQYKEWRDNVYKRDGYTCQCCGQKGGRLTAHHLLDFASHVELRFDVNNGVTLCFDCHDATVEGSFHNLYGTHYKTQEELEEYINNKRKQLGINIPFSIEEYKNGDILKPEDIDNISLGTWIFDIYSPSELKSKYKKIKVA